MRELHPACAFVLLCLLILLTAFSVSPAIIALSLCGSVAFCALTGGAWGQIRLACVMIVLFAVTNPLFSHAGETVLFYLNYNAVTVESIVYGAKIGGMMAGALCWFAAFARVLDTERLLYLFGRILPKTALLLCSGERMSTLIKRRYTAIAESRRQASLHSDSALEKIRFHAHVLSITLSVTLEQAVQSGQSMKARGYGLKGRTAYGLFRFGKQDALLLALSVSLACVALHGLLTGQALPLVGFGMLCALPALREGRELWRWRS